MLNTHQSTVRCAPRSSQLEAWRVWTRLSSRMQDTWMSCACTKRVGEGKLTLQLRSNHGAAYCTSAMLQPICVINIPPIDPPLPLLALLSVLLLKITLPAESFLYKHLCPMRSPTQNCDDSPISGFLAMQLPDLGIAVANAFVSSLNTPCNSQF